MLNNAQLSEAKVRFGAFEVDLRQRQLFRKGRQVKLQDQPFQILKLLLAEPGELVTRDVLRQELWPADTFVDFEAGLNTAIRKLRSALGDDPDSPRFVETVPRHGYRFVAPVMTARKPPGKLDSIAVLPFQDDSRNPETEYLSEGITENLIRALSQMPVIRKVIARNSVYRYKRQDIDPQQVGRDLGVRALLMGKISQCNEELSLSVELVDTVDSRHAWGAHYERRLASLQTLPDEIAGEIVQQLWQKLVPPRKQHSGRDYTHDTQAYQMYLKGRYLWNKRPTEGMVQRGIAYFQQAIERDPNFVLPYVGVADSLNTLAGWEAGATAPRIAIPQAKLAAHKALQLNRSSAEAHTSLAYASMHYDWKWEQAEAQFQQALKLNPKYSHLRHWYSHYLTAVGRHDESLAESLRVLELDPLDLIINIHLAWHHLMSRQYEPAFEQTCRTLEMEPNFHWGYFFLGWIQEQTSQPREAVRNLEKSVELSGGSTVILSALGHAYATAGDSDKAAAVLRKLRELSQTRYVSSYEVGLIHAALGEIDEAFHWLERAYEERSGWLAYIRVEPRLDCLRQDERFKHLQQRIGL